MIRLLLRFTGELLAALSIFAWPFAMLWIAEALF